MDNYPLIKISILFICGIVLQHYIRLCNIAIIAVLVSTIIVAALIYFFTKQKSANIFISVLIYISIILLGQFDLNTNKTGTAALPGNIFYSNAVIWGEVKNISLIKNNSIDFVIAADSMLIKDKRIFTNAGLLCRLYEKNKRKFYAFYNTLSLGNKIMITGKLIKARKAGNPGEFDYSYFLMSKGIKGIVNITGSGKIKILNGNKNFLDYLFKVRKIIDDKISELHSRQSSALLRGLLLADRSIIDVELKNNFINSGVVHLLAVSGLHVGYIILIIFVLTGRLNLYLRSFLTITGLIIFTLITGMPASVVRASIMAVVIIIAFLSGRSTNLENSLAIAALIILIFKPEELFEAGFQLSFSAVLSIGLFYPGFRKKILLIRWMSGKWRNIFLFIAVSLSAQIGTIPLTFYYFGKMSLIGILMNVVAIPVVGIIVGIGIFTIIFGFLMHPIAVYYAASNDMLMIFFNRLISFAGSFEYSYMNSGYFSPANALIFYGVLFFVMKTFKNFTHFIAKIIFIALTFLNLILFCPFDDLNLMERNQLNLMMIDVGQGDSFLIRFPNGKTALIDAGMATNYFDNGERRIIPLLQYLSIPRIDYAFVSHIDADHYSGFVSLVHSGKVQNLFKPEFDSLNRKDVLFEKFLKRSGVRVFYFKRGILKFGNVHLYVMNPENRPELFKGSKNNNSGFLKIIYGKTSFLFTGDIERPAELYYSGIYGDFLRSDVLKISHHGSSGGTCNTFLIRVKPRICLISAGAGNKFGHPAPGTLEKINNIKARILRTDIGGAVVLRSDGEKVSVINWK